jgi:hypothetical protein
MYIKINRVFPASLKGVKTILLVFIMLLFAPNSFSQSEKDNREVERAYEKFKQTFGREFSQPSEKTYTPVSFLPPAKLPEWFFDFNTLYPGKKLFIGVSDAGPDSPDAYQQALGRALAVAAFAQNTKVQNIHDNYYHDRNGQRTRGMFNTFTTYTAQASIAFQVLEKFQTNNGEIILLIETAPVMKDSVFVTTSIELFQSEGENEIVTRMAVEIAIKNLPTGSLNLAWQMTENKLSFGVESALNERTLPVMNARFLYHPPANAETTGDFTYRFDLKYGLAATFFHALAINLEQFEVFDSQIKTVNEQYGGRFQDLTRVIFTDEFAFEIFGIQIQKNQLHLTLKRIHQPK